MLGHGAGHGGDGDQPGEGQGGRERSRSPHHSDRIIEIEEGFEEGGFGAEDRTEVVESDRGREEDLGFHLLEDLEGIERSRKLETLVMQMSWEQLKKDLSNIVHCSGTSRHKLLKTSALLLDIRSCLEDLIKTKEEQEVNRMLIAVLKLLGKSDVDWRGLQDWEAEMLQLIVRDINLCPDIPNFLQMSYFALLNEKKEENVQVDENSNEVLGEMSTINSKVDEVVKKLSSTGVDTSECHGGEESILKKISFIKSQVDASKDITNLERSLETMKLMAISEVEEVKEFKEVDADREVVLRQCRSIEEITQIPEFKYVEQEEAIVCQVCDAKFKYSGNLERTFIEKKISPQFSHLKQVLKVHMKTGKHKMELSKALKDGLVWEREESRNNAVGMRISRIAYHLFFNGRPDTDFPLHIYINKKNGADVGDINHSCRYVEKFLIHCASAVRKRVSGYLNSRLVATNSKPPVNIIMDKFTHQHVTRQLVGVITIVPDSPQLIQALYLGAPRYVKKNDEILWAVLKFTFIGVHGVLVST